MKRIFIIIVALMIESNLMAQLDPLYKQYHFNQLMINPAYAGIYNRFSTSFITGLQWVGLEGAPVTNTLTLQSALKDGQIGLGTVLVNDRLGINNNLEAQLSASYNLKLGDAKLGMGIQGGLINYSYDLSKLTLDYVDDERLYSGLDNVTQPNFGVGFMLLSKKYFVGLSVPRILDVKVEDGVATSTRYQRHYYLGGGYVHEGYFSNSFKFSAMGRYVEGGTPSLDLSVSAFMEGYIWFGINARDLRYYGLFFILDMGKNLRLGYSFELPTNSLIQSNYGTHEISIAFDATLGKGQTLRNRYF
ncbi:PorP/SprF family type IX secretion system membrane protein [Reichenbachiella agarivorans]|uniref:PorP/SprF family type IX secretion system membrane protein n=1 Tax=Reichenbachiella agarivorans TaxID=2979464 RepID=A0ABY6CJH6_9BACT|nr:PorP/SprF family type IX secretion system membrane protein [Reichenbachiella agarivorans]UXP30627.1 PorP/SprF family type IX secretion system membrane protein [Reichenbachiella agarivorans]